MNAVDETANILSQSIKSRGVVLNILWNTGKYIIKTCMNREIIIASNRYLLEKSPTEKKDFSDLQLKA